MRRELSWAIGLIAFSIVLIGLATRFAFDSITIQLHDTYFIIGPVYVILFISSVLIIARNVYRLMVHFIHSSTVFAIAVTIVIPVALYYISVYLYLIFCSMNFVSTANGDLRLQQSSWIVYAPGTILFVFLIVLEGIAIKKIARINR